jgi:hypothetical protein
MTAAVFGLLGVVVGGFLTAMAGYFMDRRKAWTSARAAGLQLTADLEMLVEELKAKRTPRDLGTTSWMAHREALLFRQGSFPSGLNAATWLDLARRFNRLEHIEASFDEKRRPEALTELEKAVDTLKVFEPDPPALGVFVSRVLGRITRPWTLMRGRQPDPGP